MIDMGGKRPISHPVPCSKASSQLPRRSLVLLDLLLFQRLSRKLVILVLERAEERERESWPEDDIHRQRYAQRHI